MSNIFVPHDEQTYRKLFEISGKHKKIPKIARCYCGGMMVMAGIAGMRSSNKYIKWRCVRDMKK